MDPRVGRSRAAVVEAAKDLMLLSGAASVTIDAIVQRTGVARSTIYRHFPTVMDVLRAGIEALIQESELQIPIPDGATPAASVKPVDQPRASVLAFLLQLAEQLRTSSWARALPGLLDVVSRGPGLEHHRHELVRLHCEPLMEPLLSAQELGLLSPGLTADDAISFLVGPLFYRRLVSGEPITDELCYQLVDLYLGSAAAQNPRLGDTGGR